MPRLVPRAPPHQHMDARFNHNHAYFDRGYVAHDLPRDRIVFNRGPNRYYYSAGVWYAPRGGDFVVIAPPVGLFIPVLPPYYLQNCIFQNMSELDLTGESNDFPVMIKGVYPINSDQFQ